MTIGHRYRKTRNERERKIFVFAHSAKNKREFGVFDDFSLM